MLINNLKIGGAEIVFLKQLNYFRQKGCDVTLATVDGLESEKNQLKTVDTISFSFNSIYDIEGYRRFIKYVKINNVDVIYATLSWAMVVSRIIKIFVPLVKVVIRESGTSDRKNWKIKLLDICLNLFLDKIIALSREAKETLLAYQPFYKNKIEVINNGAEINISEADIVTNAKNRSNEKIVLLNVGSMKNGNKNQAGMIDAVKKIVDSGISQKIELVLVGEGSQRHHLEDVVKAYKLENNVIFAGQVKPEEMKNYYIRADIYILNSIKEGSPNTLLEAMSYGLPVISTNVGGAMDVIEEGRSGYLIDRENTGQLINKINLLIKDKELRLKMGMAAYKRIKENYLFEDQADKILQLIESI